ncbi:1525_t:CDS:1, partial [Cetraspora pellucida]
FNEFEQAAEANNWIEHYRLQIETGYLKKIAADWYKENKSSIRYWKTE